VVADPVPAGLIGPQTGRVGLPPHEAAVQASALLICLQVGIGAVAAHSGWHMTDWDERWDERWHIAAAMADTARRQFEPKDPG
jgi:hypothetical protein